MTVRIDCNTGMVYDIENISDNRVKIELYNLNERQKDTIILTKSDIKCLLKDLPDFL